jgi:hypothetical protein
MPMCGECGQQAEQLEGLLGGKGGGLSASDQVPYNPQSATMDV